MSDEERKVETPLLDWDEDETPEGAEVWIASSHVHDDGNPFLYRVMRLGDGWSIAGSDEEVVSEDDTVDMLFDTLAEAQERCEQIEREWREPADD